MLLQEILGLKGVEDFERKTLRLVMLAIMVVPCWRSLISMILKSSYGTISSQR